MAKINVLSFEIANLIAAGEVVERPASVLKELIENSIDAGAKNIVAEIKRGGVALIRVTDDGIGIDKDDLPIALQRHATSKISTKDDLARIMTLGFRGEALAAISSVCEMTIITKTRESEVGYMLTAEAGKVVDLSEVYTADGTTVVVSNLFYNVPARRKFLKKDATEAMNVVALVERVALSRPDISIQMLVDGQEKFHTPGNGNLHDTIYAVYGKEFSEKLIKVKGEADGMKLYGYIGRSDNVKKNRNLMNVFINGRYVKSLTAQAAIEKAYTSYIAPEAFPTCVLMLEMNPAVIDVNVHPAKLEVKFTDERAVFDIVYLTLRAALEDHEYRPELTLGSKGNNDVISSFLPIGDTGRREQTTIQVPSYIRDDTRRGQSYQSGGIPRSRQTNYDTPISFGSGTGRYSSQESSMTPRDSVELLMRYRDASPDVTEAPPITIDTTAEADETRSVIPHKIIGEAFDCYVMVEIEDYMLVIDKHAAHERVIFEDLKAAQKSDGRVQSQLLMLPIPVILSPEELGILDEYTDELMSVGFDFNKNQGSVDITAIPDAISAEDAETLFVRMLDDAITGKGDPRTTEDIRREKALYQIACKAAIKGGRVYDSAIIEWLVTRVLELPDITVCPHGRPIAYKLTKRELDRQFERIK